MDPATSLVARIEIAKDPQIALWFGQGRETLDVTADNEATGSDIRLTRHSNGLTMTRGNENFTANLLPCAGPAPRDIEGSFHSQEYNACFTCASAGGALYGAFSGFLGSGMMQMLVPVGPDVWRLPMPRALDSAAPGDWTLHFQRDERGRVAGVTVGCWLARGVRFSR